MATPTRIHKLLLGCGLVAAASYTIADLTAHAAASRTVVVLPLLLVATAFGLAFASGVRHAALRTQSRALRVTSVLLFAVAVLHVSAPPVLTWLVALAAITSASTALTEWPRVLSISALLAVGEFGALAAIDGGAARVATYAYLIWSVFLAGVLLQKQVATAGSSTRSTTGVSTW